MTTEANLPVEDRIAQLLQHLGIQKAHFASRRYGDWGGIVSKHQDLIASLSLVCPQQMVTKEAASMASRALIITGDKGKSREIAEMAMGDFPDAQHAMLSDYEPLGWSDPAVERTDEINTALTTFIEQMDYLDSLDQPEREGEYKGILYNIKGSGPPLVLLPLVLAPTQWDGLLPSLTNQFTTITLGGEYLGIVAMLEDRARGGYAPMVNSLIDRLNIEPGDDILDLGCGSGVYSRLLARRTGGANKIIGGDFSSYLLREATAITKSQGLDGPINFRQVNAMDLPFPDNSFDVAMSCTVMEEVDADKMLSEMLRIIRPGGRIGIIVRAVDLPGMINVEVSNEMKEKALARLAGEVSDNACADASLYSRFHKSGLTAIQKYPYLATFDMSVPNFLQARRARVLLAFDSQERDVWEAAVSQAESEGTYFVTEPFHCAVGTKPLGDS